jgi:hypothetical protein
MSSSTTGNTTRSLIVEHQILKAKFEELEARIKAIHAKLGSPIFIEERDDGKFLLHYAGEPHAKIFEPEPTQFLSPSTPITRNMNHHMLASPTTNQGNLPNRFATLENQGNPPNPSASPTPTTTSSSYNYGGELHVFDERSDESSNGESAISS